MSDVLLAFDDAVNGTTATYTSAFANLALAEGDQYAIQAVVDPEPSAVVDNITIQLETSNDGRNWANKNPVPEIFGTMGSIQTWVFVGYDIGQRPAGAMVRLRVQLGGAANGSARVKIYVRQVSASPLVPPRINGCALWLRADLGVVASGGAVSQWADQSGNGNHAVQAISTNQPALTVSDPNFAGQPTVSCTISGGGAARFLKTSAFATAINGDMTVFVVARSPGSGAANRYLFDSLDTAAQVAMYRDGAGGNLYAYTLAGGNYVSFGGAAATPVAMILTAKTGEAAALRVNSNTANQVTSGDPGAFTAAGMTIGSYAGAGSYSDWDIAELAVWGRQLTAAEMQLLNAYAAGRYGLVIA